MCCEYKSISSFKENLFTDCPTKHYILCDVHGCWNPQLAQKETGNTTHACTNGFPFFSLTTNRRTSAHSPDYILVLCCSVWMNVTWQVTQQFINSHNLQTKRYNLQMLWMQMLQWLSLWDLWLNSCIMLLQKELDLIETLLNRHKVRWVWRKEDYMCTNTMKWGPPHRLSGG